LGLQSAGADAALGLDAGVVFGLLATGTPVVVDTTASVDVVVTGFAFGFFGPSNPAAT
jgi:hypothetical protein